jgi:CRISPR/Cas system CSM-associated protein Csm2 small subunit
MFESCEPPAQAAALALFIGKTKGAQYIEFEQFFEVLIPFLDNHHFQTHYHA